MDVHKNNIPLFFVTISKNWFGRGISAPCDITNWFPRLSFGARSLNSGASKAVIDWRFYFPPLGRSLTGQRLIWLFFKTLERWSIIWDMKFSKRKSCFTFPSCGSSLPQDKTCKSERKCRDTRRHKGPLVQKALPPDISPYHRQATSFHPFIIAPFLAPFLLRLLPLLSSSFCCPIFPSCPHFTPLFHSS